MTIQNSKFINFKNILFFSVFLSGFLLCQNALATDYYIAQTEDGSGNGSSCANADALADLTWGTGNMVAAGDTLHICGTIEAAAGTTLLSVGASGEAGNVITIKFEDDAILQSPRFLGGTGNYGGAIYVNTKSYITIDGGTNGIIQNTDNGTVLGYRAGSNGILLRNSDHIEVKNLSIKNIFVPATVTGINSVYSTTTATDSLGRDMATIGVRAGMRATNLTTGASSSEGIAAVSGSTFSNTSYVPWVTFNEGDSWKVMETNPSSLGFALNLNGTSDVSLHDNEIEYCSSGVSVASYDDSNIEIYNNSIRYCAMGVYAGTASSGYGLDNISIHDNIISDNEVFGYNDGIKFTGQGLANNNITQVHIYNNKIGPNIGTATSLIMADHANYTDAVHGPLIYNNLLLLGNENPANALQLGGYSASETSACAYQLYNNTLISLYTGSDLGIDFRYGATGNIFKNNIIAYPNTTGSIYVLSIHENATMAESDNNIFYVPNGTLTFFDSVAQTFSTWKSNHPLFDANSLAINPSLSVLYKPDSVSDPTVGAGANLTNLGITTLNSDKDGIARPASGAWDIGAYEYVGAADTTAPASPTGLSVS